MKNLFLKSTRSFITSVVLLSLLMSSLMSVLQPINAAAISGSDWQAGNIISDSIFTNSSSMGAAAIQNFLNSKVPTCDTNGTQLTSHPNGSGGYYTRAQWGSINGNPAPFTCLKDYVENTTTKQNNFSSPGTPISGGISAAQIIWNAAQQYHINPQVILVTLQKEQGLVTDDWPWYGEYKAAMGYGCPDTAACDSKYYGFFNQVDNAAWQFRYYLDHPGAFNYWIGNNYIQYNPDSSCGGSVVNIQNAATAALYIYTPYQPNAGSLAQLNNNSPGGTAPCGAYGNRNFWWYFNTWFGPSSPNFQATYAGQSPYPTIVQGQTVNSYMRYYNSGNLPWYDDVSAPQYKTYAVHLAATNPINRGSVFSSGVWPSANRATGIFAHVYEGDGVTLAANQHVAQPGQMVEFDFLLHSPGNLTPGYYQEFFQPVLEGSVFWNMGGVAWTGVTVQSVSFQATYAGESSFPTVPKGQSASAYFRYQNTGNMPWYDDISGPQYKTYPVHLATSNPINRASSFSAGWPTNNRAAGTFAHVYQSDGTTLTSDQHVVLPGQVAEFDFNFTASPGAASGQYQEFFQPVLEGSVYWNMGAVTWLRVNVP